MEGRNRLSRICAFLLAASLIAVDAMPAFAAAGPEEPEAKGYAQERNAANQEITPAEDTITSQEIISIEDIEEDPVNPGGTGRTPQPGPPNGPRAGTEMPDTSEPGIFGGTDSKPEMFSLPEAGEREESEQQEGEESERREESVPGIQEGSNGLIYLDGVLYTGYYLGPDKKLYYAKKGGCTLKTGTVKAGVQYYSYPAKKFLQIKKQALYVKGKVYTGFYMSKAKKMYRAKKGARTLVTGILEAGTKYYGSNAQKTRKLPKQTLYVKGKLYSGYYLDPDNKMYSVKKGACTLANTALNAGTKYYSHNAKRTRTLPQMTVYIYGKAMKGMSPESLATLQRAQAVVASITDEGMAKEEKLRACFEFVKTYQGGWPRVPHYKGMDWPVVYANDMFVNDGKGNCFSYAAAFAYMAKALGYEEVYACHSGGHGWAEIGGLIYDPERNKFDPGFHYYGVSYDEKTKVDYKGGIAAGHPWMRIKI